MDYKLTDHIAHNEINALLESFWGKNNSIAQYSQKLFTCAEAWSIIDDLKRKNLLNKISLLQSFKRSLISFGIREGEKLIAHSGLLVQPWGEVETIGSIVAVEQSGKGLMGIINDKKRNLLKVFAENDFDLTSYVIVGSKSVYHANSIFNFPELGIRSFFGNIGPYVYRREYEKIDRPENKYLMELSVFDGKWTLSHSAQIIGIESRRAPYVYKNIHNYVPEVVTTALNSIGFKETNTKSTEGINEKYISPARIAIHIIREGTKNIAILRQEILSNLIKDRSVIVRVPLIYSNKNVFEELENLADITPGFKIIFTGLSKTEIYWCACYSYIRNDLYPKYIRSLKQIENMSENSLSNLASILLSELKSHNAY